MRIKEALDTYQYVIAGLSDSTQVWYLNKALLPAIKKLKGYAVLDCPAVDDPEVMCYPDTTVEDLRRLPQSVDVLDDFGNGDDEIDNQDPVVITAPASDLKNVIAQYANSVLAWWNLMTSRSTFYVYVKGDV